MGRSGGLWPYARYALGAALVWPVLWWPLLAWSQSARSVPEAALDILVEDAAAPWSRTDGSGYANDIVRAAFRAAAVDVRLIVVPYARCKRMAATGRAAGCFSMSPDPLIEGKVVLSERPLFTTYAVYFVDPRRPLRAKSEAELSAGTVIGTVIGYEYPVATLRLRARGVEFEEARNEAINLRKLAAGRLDAAIVTLDQAKTAAFVLKEAGLTGQLVEAFRTPSFGAYVGFSVQHPQGEWARQRFNRGYAAIAADGELARIAQRWGLKPDESKPAAPH